MRKLLFSSGLMLMVFSANAQAGEGVQQGTKEQPVAVIQTSMGDLKCVLLPKVAPLGTANFIGLASGTKDWTDPKTGTTKHGVPLYDNTTFHRIVPGFMIQGGDPAGSGSGNVGFQFENENGYGLNFDRPGRLAYSNAGKGTNGSQFFITEFSATFLNGNYTIFGQCDDASVELVKKIARQPRNGSDRPDTPIWIKHIKIDDGSLQGDSLPDPKESTWIAQTSTPVSSVPPSAPLKLPALYVSAQTPADQLQLNADNSFSLQEDGQPYHGTFMANGKTLELSISETSIKTTLSRQGNDLTDSSGQTWRFREQSTGTAPGGGHAP